MGSRKNYGRMAALVAIFVCGYWISTASVDRVEVAHAATSGEKAPNIKLSRLDGRSTTLRSYEGQWVVLNFWATWCRPCVGEMPSLESFYKTFSKKNMTVLAVSVDEGDPDKVSSFVKKHGLTFEIFHDPESRSARFFNVRGLPTTIVINPKGEVVSKAFGEREWDDPIITDYFNNLIKQN